METTARVENCFKETELGLLPEDWELLELRNSIDLESGKRMKGGALKHGEVPSLGGEHITEWGGISWENMKYISEDFYKKLKKGRIRLGDILICKDGARTGKLAFTKSLPCLKCAVNEHIFIVRSKHPKQLLNQFLFYYLFSKSGQYQIRRNFHGIIGGIKREDVYTIKTPLPPLMEQRRIAFVFSKIQQALEQQDKILETTKNLKKSLMQKLFTEGIGHTEFKDSEIGEIPENWKIKEIGDIITSSQYGLSIKGEKQGQYPILRMNNLENGHIVTGDLQYVNLDNDTLIKFKLDKNDILFNRTNSIDLVGKTSIFDLNLDAVFASYLIRLKVKSGGMHPQFLNFYLNWNESQTRLKGLATRAVGQSNISATRLKTFLVPIPPYEEQEELVSVISALDKKMQTEEKRKVLFQHLFKTMLQKLMTGEIRVNDLDLGVYDVN